MLGYIFFLLHLSLTLVILLLVIYSLVIIVRIKKDWKLSYGLITYLWKVEPGRLPAERKGPRVF